MPSLNRNGPYQLDKKTVDEKVSTTAPTSAGNYALGKWGPSGTFSPHYVGRSDSDINERLNYWVENSKHTLFKFSYASTTKEAYIKECRNYYEFAPPEKCHPDKPKGTNYNCPVCGV